MQGPRNHQLPSTMVAQELGEVNVKLDGQQQEICFTILMEPTGQGAEGWKTGVALDASTSMKWAYGKKLEGQIPADVKKEYVERGWISSRTVDGVSAQHVTEAGMADAKKRGYVQVSDNVIEPLARKFIAYLADGLDVSGETALMYWACGDGSDYEFVGSFNADKCDELSVTGPKKTGFGTGTQLLPAMQFFVKHFAKARQSMAIFLTDGQLEDFAAVKAYTVELANGIAKNKLPPLKFVLIGVGSEISRSQLEELDDLDTGTDVDIWDHKIAHEMRSLTEIFAEVVSEHQVIAPMGAIYDAQGKLVKRLSDGVPAKISFTMPKESEFFDLIVGEYRVRQRVRE